MKMLFSARNRAQIEKARDALLAAGIRCEIREFPVDAQEFGMTCYPELWVDATTDYHTASILYASPISVMRQRTAAQ